MAYSKDRMQEYCRVNSAKAVERTRQWRLKNPERRRAHSLLWLARHPDQAAANCAKRRARKLNATPKWLTPEQLAAMARTYYYAYAFGCEVDHVVPLQGKTVCGLHVPWNLQILDPESNKRKGSRLMEAA